MGTTESARAVDDHSPTPGNSGDVTEARDAEEQKTRNRSLAIVPLIFYPDGAGGRLEKNGRAYRAGVRV